MSPENESPPPRTPIVAADFVVPTELITEHTVLWPLEPKHNLSDYEAWTSSIEHIRATPGFPDGDWPDGALTLDGNLADLKRHARHFRDRVGFTYTVLNRDHTTEVVGCVYIYGDLTNKYDAEVQSWVKASHAALAIEIRAAVTDWLKTSWPFATFLYADR